VSDEDELAIPKVRKVELPEPGPRKPLSKWEFAKLFLDQLGRCFKCGCKLEKGKTFDEHLVPRETLPADVCDALENRKLYCSACAKEKTPGDQALIAKGRRVRGERGSQVKRRAENGGSRIKSNPVIARHHEPLKGRGFTKHPKFKRTISGEVVPRMKETT
jgi:hypothetical protein